MNKFRILVTGSAGFIGFHLADRLIKEHHEVVGIDILNSYYDISLKYSRLSEHGISKDKLKLNKETKSSIYLNYKFVLADIADYDFIVKYMKNVKFDFVVNLAAQAGVRYSIDNPRAYSHSNIDGFLSILEGCRFSNVKHLIYASTSSVYGLNTKMPLVENMPTEHPMAFYAATKKANELMAHSYSHLFQLPTTGLRFFTVYGSWGRPDMALFLFVKAILKGEQIKVFNNGEMIRDFTFVNDIVESVYRLIIKPAKPNLNWSGNNPEINTSSAPYQIFNVGNSSPIKLMDYIEALEFEIGIKANKYFLPMQDGDVPATHADATALEEYIKFKPKTKIEDGIREFVHWYKKYYKVD